MIAPLRSMALLLPRLCRILALGLLRLCRSGCEGFALANLVSFEFLPGFLGAGQAASKSPEFSGED